jgi:hypothetical protein
MLGTSTSEEWIVTPQNIRMGTEPAYLLGFKHRGNYKVQDVTLDEIRCSSARRVRKPRLAFQQT